MTKITVELFGGPVVGLGEKSVELSPYQGYVLAVVFGHGPRGVSRSRIARLLWGRASESLARRCLSQHLYSLSLKTGRAPLVEAQGDILIGRTQDVSCDLPRFVECLREDRLSEAAELLAAGFLSALADRPTREFDDWVSGRALSLRSELRDRATAVWSGAEPTGNWRSAQLASEVLLRLDPVDERALRRVLLSTAMAGHVHEAEATYTSFVERAEYPATTNHGSTWAPDQETAQLVTRIRALCDRGGPSGALSDEPEPDAPLCGRQTELTKLRQVVSAPPEANAVTALIVGEGGAGKTRLVEESLIAAHLAGLRVLRGRSSEFEREIPLNPILEALSDPDIGMALGRLDDPWRTVMLSLLPQFQQDDYPLPDLGYIQPGSIPRRLYEAVHRLLLEVVRDGPICLFIDDFHWADQTSLTVLDFLRRRWKSGGLIIVLAARPEATRPGSSTERYLRDLPASRAVRLIGLEELSVSAAEELITAVAGRSLPDRVISDLRTLGGHNPFFLIELTLEHLAGRLSSPHYRTHEIPVPGSIRQLFHQRLDGLSADARRAADLLAVADRPICLKDLSHLVGTSETDVVSSVEELVRLRLIRWQNARAIPRHPLVRETMYQALPGARRASLHGQIAEFLLQGTNPPVDELALHFDRAGEQDSALKYATEAADRAEAAGAVAEALQYLEIAVRNQPDDEGNAELLGRLAHLNRLQRNLREAATLFTSVAQVNRKAGREEEALWAEVHAVEAMSQRGLLPVDEVSAELRRLKSAARDRSFDDVLARALDVEARLHASTCSATQLAGTLAEAEHLTDVRSDRARCWIHAALTYRVALDSPEVAAKHGRLGAEIARAAGLRSELFVLLSRRIAVLIPLGRLMSNMGQEAIREAQQMALRNGDLFQRFNIQVNLGVWWMEASVYEQASVEFGRAKAIIEDTQAITAHVILNYNLGELARRTLCFDEAERFFSTAERLWEPGTPEYGLSLISAGRGLCALEAGRLSEAAEREQELPPDDTHWVFNPYSIILLRGRIMERKGRRAEALDYLDVQANRLRHRMVPTWLNLKLEQGRLLRKLNPDSLPSLWEDVLPVARAAGFKET
jgi:DNA-binding SARP family transcriptional activator/tetratricopeptide (TPR) repeat protein